jgi:hypothetical protein
VQHIAAVGLSEDPVRFDDDGAGNEVFSPAVDAGPMPRPPTGNKPTERKRATHRRTNEAGVIAGDLKDDEMHGQAPSIRAHAAKRP